MNGFVNGFATVIFISQVKLIVNNFCWFIENQNWSKHYVNRKSVHFYYLTVIPYIIKTMWNHILMKF